MEMSPNDIPRSAPSRRRRRSKMQIFKEAYLPTIILAVTIVLIIVFIIGAAVDGDRPEDTKPSENVVHTTTQSAESTTPTPQQSTAPTTVSTALTAEAANRIAEAELLAADYDYEGAMAVLMAFSGDMEQFPELLRTYQQYLTIQQGMVSWKAGDVYNLSFHILIADPARAFVDAQYGNSYKKNFITISEFSAILQQLYDNGYVLVSLDDFYVQEFNSSSGRYIFQEKELLLPAGKKPVMITETNANYYTYMTDSNGDGKPDAGADGFASRLCHDGNRFYNELVNADGSVSTGSYDLVPLLEDFIAEHPDFSYKGARAIIAFSGYDGVLGYRITSTTLGAAALEEERAGAVAIVEALKNAGYDLACFTYGNYSNGTLNYGELTPTQVKDDIQKWLTNIATVIGNLDILVYARDVDIAGSESYSGNSKFNVLYNAGFRYFLGAGKTTWNQVDNQYVRHNRLSVTGNNLLNNSQLYAELFDASEVKDSARG